MSAANGAAVTPGETMSDSKGKGKAVEQKAPPSHDMSMDEDEGSSEGEESGNECEPVSCQCVPLAITYPSRSSMRSDPPN